MTAKEFLKMRNIIPKDGNDLIIGFDNGTKESLIELLKEYHESELKKLRVGDVSVSVCDCMKNLYTEGIYIKCRKCGNTINIQEQTVH